MECTFGISDYYCISKISNNICYIFGSVRLLSLRMPNLFLIKVPFEKFGTGQIQPSIAQPVAVWKTARSSYTIQETTVSSYLPTSTPNVTTTIVL